MATLILGSIGSMIGAKFGGAILGMSGATIGGFIGTAIGQTVDAWIVARLSPQQSVEGARLDSLRVTSAAEGGVLPRLYGRMRVGGTIIWATDFTETKTTRRERVSKFQKVSITEYDYTASFAVALCEGPISGIGRVWADGKPMDLEEVAWRWYPGDEDQEPDPYIAAKMGAETPAYRGAAYVVFEELALEAYGNRLPQLSFEVYRPLADEDTAEGLVKAVTIIPASGEFAYATEVVRKAEGGADGVAENVNAAPGIADATIALDQLQMAAPAVESASLVVSWFGSDLRAGVCTVKPKVEIAVKATTPAWAVNGVTRAQAEVVSQIDDSPAYGGTPSDASVVQSIQALRDRGLRVTFYPFLMMDVPAGNTLPNPWSDNAAGVGQPALPWRGRITCSPAAGFTGTVDQTGAAADQVAAFFGTAQPGDFNVAGTTVTWSGGADWGFRRMILHYAHLCAAAGGVDSFIIASEMRGLTTIRSGPTAYPAVEALRALARDVRAILGPQVKISYAADWSEYFGHQPGDGSGDVLFHLDPLWADPEIDFIGIDNYMPLSDWRDGHEHLDAQAGWQAVQEPAYLRAHVAAGEGYDWYYASAEDRAAQVRTPIIDTYPIERDIAVPREIEGPAFIGATGLLVNSYHQVLGRDGYFHADSGTSEGQFVMIYASARAALALASSDPAVADSYSRRSRLLASTLEDSFYRRPYTDDPDTLFVPHWLVAARDSFELQSVDLGHPVNFQPVSGGRLRGVIPASAGGDVLLKVFTVRAMDAHLLWENPYSSIVGTQYWLTEDAPEIDAAGAAIHIWGTEPVQARVVFSYNRGEVLPIGQPYEAWPLWRRLEPREIACAGDAMRWAILAYDALHDLHGGTLWQDLSTVTKANTVRAFAVDDGRWMIKPSRAGDPYATAGLFTFESRPTTWVRDVASGGFRASIPASTGESQIGRGFEVPLSAGETLTIRLGATVATTDVSVFVDTAPGYDPATRWIADLTLAGTGVQEFVLPLSAFLRLSDNTPLSGAPTLHGLGVIDREAAAHVIVIESARPTQSNDPDFAPYITPFTINVLGGDIIDWRGVPGSGYQAPDLWAEIGGDDGPAGMMVHADFLCQAQVAWQAEVGGGLGPFAHAYVWDRFDAEDFGEAPGTWVFDWHDPNSRWAGYQYRPLDATARAIYRTEGLAAYDAARALCITVTADFLAWLNGTGWTSGVDGPPTDFPPSGPVTEYHEPHFAALILRSCLYALMSPSYRDDAGREAQALALAGHAWAYLETRFVHHGPMAGTWSGGAEQWFGFWHAEIIDTLSEMLLGAAAVTAELAIDPAVVRARLVAADAWIEAASAAELGTETGESWIFRYKDLRRWWSRHHHDRPGGTRSETPTDWEPQSKPIVFTEYGCPAIDRGPNQPNVFYDPKSSESFVPYFSRGWRDDAVQRSYLEATNLFWADPTNNPVSAVYGGRMVHVPECAAWTWDARPYPQFPALSEVWADSQNWRLGHWLTGRLGAVSLAALVRHLCARAGHDPDLVDVSGLWGAVEGLVIPSAESPRATIAALARHFGFDAVETGGLIRFAMRGRAPALALGLADLMVNDAGGSGPVEPVELTRAQETELPQSLRWQVARADEDYDSAVVEAQRLTTTATRLAAEAFPMAVAPEEADRRVRRALAEAWIGREGAALTLPPSRLALDPGDVIRLDHDGRGTDYRLVTVADALGRRVEGIRQELQAYDLPPGSVRGSSIPRPVTFGAPLVLYLDLPPIFAAREAHHPFVAAHAQPWPGRMAVWRSVDGNAYDLLDTFTSRAQIGTLVTDLPGARYGSALMQRHTQFEVEFIAGSMASVSDLQLFAGANLLAVESAPGVWELLHAGTADLIGPRHYRLGRLLRGQHGTEHAIGSPTEAGARVVLIDTDLPGLPIPLAALGAAAQIRVGPVSRPYTDPSFAAATVTPVGVGLRPFSPMHLRMRRGEGEALALAWIRRSRHPDSDNWALFEVPLGEDSERYLVEILDGETVVRSWTVTEPRATYTAAAQTADWGAPLALGTPLTFRVSQISATIGPGYPGQRTIEVST